MSLINRMTDLHCRAVRGERFWLVSAIGVAVADIVLYFAYPQWLPFLGGPAWFIIGYGYWRGYRRALRNVAAIYAKLGVADTPPSHVK